MYFRNPFQLLSVLSSTCQAISLVIQNIISIFFQLLSLLKLILEWNRKVNVWTSRRLILGSKGAFMGLSEPRIVHRYENMSRVPNSGFLFFLSWNPEFVFFLLFPSANPFLFLQELSQETQELTDSCLSVSFSMMKTADAWVSWRLFSLPSTDF